MDTASPYTLTINGSPVSPDVLRFRGTEALSKPFSWRIEFTTPQANIRPEQVLMKYASFAMRDNKVVHGIITGLEWLSTNADQSHYRITLESRLALLSHTRRCAVFLDKSVPEVVEQILRAHGLEEPDFEFRLERTYPSRELITQWRETDLQFIQRILAEVGIWFRQEMNDVTELELTVFCDSQTHYQFNHVLPYHEPSGLYDGAELCGWGIKVRFNTTPAKVTTRDYNYRTAADPMDSTAEVRSPAVTTGGHYRYAEPYQTAGDELEPETESGAFYARLHHERLLNKSALVHLFSNAYWLSPGMVIEPQGLTLRDIPDGILIYFTSYIGARDSRLHVSVWGMPYSEQFCCRPPEIPRPVMYGSLPARIESRQPHDNYAHLDRLGRYRVKLDFSREDAEPGYNFLWVRMAKPYAGETHGWHTPLTDGTEVGILFDGGDPDKPYIGHAFHDSEHPDIVNRDNRSQNILRTAGKNEIRLEDKRGEEHIALNTEFGKTQLNQGHIVDDQNKQRGIGFELRTDEYGVIRVAKGLFISADGQTKGQGEVLDMNTALREIEVCQQQMQHLAAAARQAEALEADIASQLAMFNQRLKPLNEMLHFSAPQGIAFTSGEHMQLAAEKNVAMNAGGDISAGAMGNIVGLAGEQVGLFARTGKLSVISSEGPVQIQAQNGAMHLSAEQKLSLVSAADMLFAGKKKVTLIGGGSYVIIDAGKVEYGTAGTYTRKIKRTTTTARATMPVSMPRMGTPYIYSAIYQLQDEQGNILSGTPYSLKTSSGQTATGYSDDEGRTVPVYSRQPEDVKLHIVQEKPQQKETLWFVGGDDNQQLTTELREDA
ncbi:type VI secretion system Vgr family protein [Ewingella sp. S1.OA.A_B6]